VSSIQNARAIEATLARLQGPCATGKLLVKALGPDVLFGPGECAVPFDGGAYDPQSTVFVKPNPAFTSGTWVVTQAGTLVDVEALQGGTVPNRPGGTPYRWEPPITGIELESVADAAGLVGGAFSEAFAGLRQFVHYKSLDREGIEALFKAQLFDFPAAALSWVQTVPLDGPMSGTPGPRTNRVSSKGMLYRHTWMLWLVTSRLDLEAQRRHEGDTLRADVLEIIFGAKRARDGAFQVSMEPGAEVQNASPYLISPTSYVDQVTFSTIVLLENKPEPREYHDWLRTRLRQQTPPQAPDPAIDIPNLIIGMPPGGPGPGPFP
jgi:hypothetical protein